MLYVNLAIVRRLCLMNDAVLYEDELLQVRALERFIVVVERVS